MWNEIIKSSHSGHVLLLNAKVQQLSDEMIREFGLYIQRNDIGVIDVKVLNKDIIISGGLYLCSDENMPVKVRCLGGHKDYSGYENAMIYARDVSCALPLCALINKAIWEKLDGFDADMDSETVIEYSYRVMKGGYHNIWTPFIQADIAIDNEEIITLLCKKNGVMAEDKDSYISKKVFDNALE